MKIRYLFDNISIFYTLTYASKSHCYFYIHIIYKEALNFNSKIHSNIIQDMPIDIIINYIPLFRISIPKTIILTITTLTFSKGHASTFRYLKLKYASFQYIIIYINNL